MKKTYIFNIIAGKKFTEDITEKTKTGFDFVFDKIKTSDNDYFVFGAISYTQTITPKELPQIIKERKQILKENNYIVYEITAEKEE